MSDEQYDDHAEARPITSGNFEFRGVALERFSFDRQTAWQAMLSGSVTRNDALVVFLCLTPIAEVRSLLDNPRKEAEFLGRLSDWCEREGVTIQQENPARVEIARIARAIDEDLARASFAPAFPGAAAPAGSGNG